jgi:hypothetical protein
MSLNDKASAEIAKINYPFKNWRNVAEQPYVVTSRIPIKRESKLIVKEPKHSKPVLVSESSQLRITPKTQRITPVMPKLKSK